MHGHVTRIRKNAPMSATARALALIGRLEEDSAWRFLRADNAPVVAALLAEHLGGEHDRLDADDLYELIDADLEQLRSQGLELKQTARAYVADWRTAGFLVRRAVAETRGETLELSGASIAALKFLESLEAPRRSATESRLASLSTQLRQLAIDTDPEVTRRLQRLQEQRDAIDARIVAIREGSESALEGERALERVHDLLAQADAVPDDFARVRSEFEQLNATLRASILDAARGQGEVLDDVFRGVDLIAESDAGRTFSAFSALVLDPALGTAFDDDMHQILDRDFSRSLTTAERRTLRDFHTTLKDRSADIHSVITQFARGLRRYVRSQDYQQDRVLRALIQEALSAAHSAAQQIKPYQLIGVDVELTAVSINSVGALALHDPAELDATAEVETHDGGLANLAELRALARATEIDFDELTGNVNAMLDGSGTPTIAEVLEAYPATQGVASVVGLLALAASHGREEREHADVLPWTGADGNDRQARVVRYRFIRRLP